MFTDIQKNKDYEAIILTDVHSNIEWVNKGFTKMTGYAANYSKGKRPSFLQGDKTCKGVINKINKNLKSADCIKQTVINYKKNGDIYNCNIEIFPLKNNRNIVTHFLALEKEIAFLG